jgi:hypothetical protein
VVDPSPDCPGSVQASMFPASITTDKNIIPKRLADSILFVIGTLLEIHAVSDTENRPN